MKTGQRSRAHTKEEAHTKEGAHTKEEAHAAEVANVSEGLCTEVIRDQKGKRLRADEQAGLAAFKQY